MTRIATASEAVLAELPWLTVGQMIEVDRAMVEDFTILLPQMMEHAGRNLARLAVERFDVGPGHGCVVVLAGPGGNGGGALVCARRLAAWGVEVSIVLSASAERFTGVPRHQLQIVTRLGLAISDAGPLPSAEPTVIIDGLIGYSLSGAPRGRAAEIIAWANESAAPILSLDVPSGLDATTGAALEPAIRATATMTLALPKEGLRSASGPDRGGELYLADIGVPLALYRREPLLLSVPNLFRHDDIVRLR